MSRDENPQAVICIFPYCHADWAWGHSRYWHVNRYVKVLDEVIELLERHANFRFFFDSFVEFLPPFIKARPAKLSKLDEYIKAGRIAIVGGQYCNLRPATAGEESFIRNIQLGRAEIRKLFPSAKFSGFANLDTAVGHSQLPQILGLSEYEYYLFWRPEWGLDKQDVPRVFVWNGLDGSKIVGMRQCYGDLSSKSILSEPIKEHLEEIREHIMKSVGAFLEQNELNAAIIYAGMDDALPLKDMHDDTPLAIFELIELWNNRFDEKLAFCTPDEFFQRLKLNVLPEISGPIDAADVCYNGPFGSNNLQPMRLMTEGAIQYAEMIYALFADVRDVAVENTFVELWKSLLTATAHATQFLFDEDYKQLKRSLEDARLQANAIAEKIIDKQFGTVPVQDSDIITLINPLPYERQEIIAVPVVNVDLSKRSFALFDGTDKLETQFGWPKNPHRLAEIDVLTKITIPPSGYKQIRIVAEDKPLRRQEIRAIPKDYVLKTNKVSLTFVAGRLVEIETEDNKITSDKGVFELNIMSAKSSLDPVFDSDSESNGWMTAGLEPKAETFQVKQLNIVESGTLRLTVQRILESERHKAVQLIYVYEDGTIECKTKIFVSAENVMIGMSFPADSSEQLICGIPFGNEQREIDKIPYQTKVEGNSIERIIPGVFWSYDWLISKSEDSEYGIITPFGDRYWLRPDWNKKEIIHLLVRSYEPFIEPERWEYHSCINRVTTGMNEFIHVLVADRSKLNPAGLSRMKQRYVFPVRSFYSNPKECSEQSFVKCEPENIRITSVRRIKGEIEMRLLETAGKASNVILEFAKRIRFVRKMNLAERYLGYIGAKGNTVEFEIGPYQIMTLRIAFAADDILPDEPIGELRIETLESSDLSSLLRFYNSLEISAVEKYRPFGWVTEKEALEKGTFKRIKENKEISLVIKDEKGNIWGHSFIILGDDKAHPPTFGIGLHKALRGKGFGKKIMQRVLDLSDNVYKLPCVGLTVLKENVKAAGLYQSLGFEIIEEFDSHDDKFVYLRMIRKRTT